MDEPDLIRLEGVSKIYGSGEAEVVALDDIDLTIETGEFVAVLGPSGSGKSTAMNILGTLDTPDGRTLFFPRHRCWLADARPARAAAAQFRRLRVPGVQPSETHQRA